MRRLLAVGAVLFLSGCAAPVGASAPVGHGEIRLVGTWTGELDRSGEGIVAMNVTTAADDGTAFDGELTWAADGAETTTSIQASMTPHGHLVAAIDPDASVEAHISDPATLDYCFVRYGFDPVYFCGRLVRQG